MVSLVPSLMLPAGSVLKVRRVLKPSTACNQTPRIPLKRYPRRSLSMLTAGHAPSLGLVPGMHGYPPFCRPRCTLPLCVMIQNPNLSLRNLGTLACAEQPRHKIIPGIERDRNLCNGRNHTRQRQTGEWRALAQEKDQHV
jgi:hypothetical protein